MSSAFRPPAQVLREAASLQNPCIADTSRPVGDHIRARPLFYLDCLHYG